MNIFELNILASPVGGLVGGIMASSDDVAGYRVGAAVGGIVIGFSLYFGIIGLGILTEKIVNYGVPRNADRLDRAGSIIGFMVLIPMMVLPVISGIVTYKLYNYIF